MCGHFAYQVSKEVLIEVCGEEAYRRWMEYNRKKTICGKIAAAIPKTDTDATFMHMKTTICAMVS